MLTGESLVIVADTMARVVDMTSTPDTPEHDGGDLAELREQIDELKNTPTEELIDPAPAEIAKNLAEPEPTEAPGSVDWGDPEEAVRDERAHRRDE